MSVRASAGSNRVLQFLEVNAPRDYSIAALSERLATNAEQVRVWIVHLKALDLVENIGNNRRALYRFKAEQ